MMRKISYLVIACGLAGCSQQENNSSSFDKRVKCDELVREKFRLIESGGGFRPARQSVITSNVNLNGRCYGLIDRQDAISASYRLMIDGVSGEQLAMISKWSDSLVMTGRRNSNGAWEISDEKTVEGDIVNGMKSNW
jgi:hypothetical protein